METAYRMRIAASEVFDVRRELESVRAEYGTTMWMAGSGIRGGKAFGSTGEFGFKAVEDRVSIHDLHATILHQLGIDHERLTYRYAGRDFRLTDVHGQVVKPILV